MNLENASRCLAILNASTLKQISDHSSFKGVNKFS